MAKRKKAKPESSETAPPAGPWPKRIKGYGEEPPGQLVPNPKNWRTHPKAQEAALGALLREIGLTQNVIVNKRTGRLVDGHLRVALAIRDKQPTVPITYVDLNEEQEALALASFDPVAGMAEANKEALASLLSGVKIEAPAVRDMLEALGHQFGITAIGEPGLTEDDAIPEPPEVPVTVAGDLWLLGAYVKCPHCGSEQDV